MDAPKTLDYGPPFKRNYRSSRRDLAGAVFVLLAVPPGLLVIFAAYAVISCAVVPPPPEVGGFWEIMGYALGFGLISALLCFYMVKSAMRRLRPPLESHQAPSHCDSISP
jgi:hypothetical protein